MNAHLRRQERSRNRLREAVRQYAAMRGATGSHTDTVPVTLRGGHQATAFVTVNIVPTTDQERTP